MAGTGRTTSYWMDTAAALRRPRLSGDARADVCVVGAGIAGLSVAYELARAGRSVVVVEARQPGAGETGRTTAHLANAMDDRFTRLSKLHGGDGARGAAASHGAAIDRIEEIVAGEGIAAGFLRVDGWLYPGAGRDRSDLEKEMKAARDAGLDATIVDAPPVTLHPGPALRFPRQAEFHPLRYLEGLLAGIERHGGQVFGGTRAVDVEEGKDGARVCLKGGGEVVCEDVVLATNSPARHVLTTAKMLPYRTFAVALAAPPDVPRGLYWDMEDPYHYVRLGGTDADAVLIVGGADHQTGAKDDGEDRLDGLEAWARERFPGAGAVTHRWSGQVLEPADALAFIGRSPGSDHVWIVTGDSGQGMTHGALAGLLLRDLLAGRGHPWADLYAPARLRLRGAKEYARDGLSFGRHYLDWLLPGEVESEEDVQPGHGAVLRRGIRPVAVYRDREGAVHRRSAVCTHMGCVVHWNSTERSWDCPCHGSRFEPTGEVLNGPAAAPLDEAE